MVRLALFVCFMILAGCDEYPKDAQGTLETVQSSQILRVGIIRHKPWAYQDGSKPQGIEVEIVSGFAQSVNARPQWRFLSESQATENLKNYEIDLVIGGLTEDNPRKKEIGFTRSYLITGDDKKDRHVMAVPKGENRFITVLEKFLKARQSDIQKMYRE